MKFHGCTNFVLFFRPNIAVYPIKAVFHSGSMELLSLHHRHSFLFTTVFFPLLLLKKLTSSSISRLLLLQTKNLKTIVISIICPGIHNKFQCIATTIYWKHMFTLVARLLLQSYLYDIISSFFFKLVIYSS